MTAILIETRPEQTIPTYPGDPGTVIPAHFTTGYSQDYCDGGTRVGVFIVRPHAEHCQHFNPDRSVLRDPALQNGPYAYLDRDH